jgi:hypothetical protein
LSKSPLEGLLSKAISFDVWIPEHREQGFSIAERAFVANPYPDAGFRRATSCAEQNLHW